jgi:hypothetical protein
MLNPAFGLGDRMDGLDRLIEMLEKRFGKLWADLLLLIVVAGAVGWALNAFFSYLVVPVAHFVKGVIDYFHGAPLTLSKSDVRGLAVQLAVSAIAALLVYLFLRFLISGARKRGAAIKKELEGLLQTAKQEMTLMREEYVRLEGFRAELAEAARQQLFTSKELEALASGAETHLNARFEILDARHEEAERLLGEAQAVLKKEMAMRSPGARLSEDE